MGRPSNAVFDQDLQVNWAARSRKGAALELVLGNAPSLHGARVCLVRQKLADLAGNDLWLRNESEMTAPGQAYFPRGGDAIAKVVQASL